MQEPWLRGPLPGVEPVLLPAAHALVHAREEIGAAVAQLDDSMLWKRPGGAASVGFHLRHLANSTRRLLAYAAGRQLTDQERELLRAEKGEPRAGDTLQALATDALAALDQALDAVRAADVGMLHDRRAVGRTAESTVYGILSHVGEHAVRHAAQVTTTVKVLGVPPA